MDLVGLVCFQQCVLQLLPAQSAHPKFACAHRVAARGDARRAREGGGGRGVGSPEILYHGHLQDLQGKHRPITGLFATEWLQHSSHKNSPATSVVDGAKQSLLPPAGRQVEPRQRSSRSESDNDSDSSCSILGMLAYLVLCNPIAREGGGWLESLARGLVWGVPCGARRGSRG